MAHIGNIHQRDDHFESPQAFQPERFLGKRPEINYYAPFGGGLHSCKRKAEREKRQTILNLPGKGVRVVFKGVSGR